MQHEKTTNAPKIGFVSLGCPKALVDSERIITRLRAEGYDFSPSHENADLVIVNTCGFIDDAVQESLDNIGEAISKNGKVVVTGCLGAKGNIIKEHFPEVLKVTGPQAYEDVLEAVHEHCPAPNDPFTSLIPPQGIKLTPRHYAYLKISEGCNHKCTFCIIPSMRGKLVSRPIDHVLHEAKRLANAGVKELLIISQDTSAYGVDLKYQTAEWNNEILKTKFYDLVKALSEFGIWVRLHYVYPYPHVDEIIPLMAEGKILPYLDIPFQHANARILSLMKRPAGGEKVLERIAKWRSISPEIAIRSTFIVGFPGETEDEFQELLDFLKEAQLDRAGCFKYSPVEGAKANDLPDPIPEEIQEERYQRFMETQAEIVLAKQAKKVDQAFDVLIDDLSEEYAIGRTYADAPEIDGLVYIAREPALKVGEIVKAKIVDYDHYDLFGEVL
ncbi:MAG: 30S ribosomal protein S12 methylthiotransferase RimO [Gammaproteobacteria bacterium]